MHSKALPSAKSGSLIILGVALIFALAIYMGYAELVILFTVTILLGTLVLLNARFGLYLAIVLMPLEGAGRLIGDLSTITWAKLVLLITVLGLLLVRMFREEELLLPKGMWLLYVVFACAVVGTALSFQLAGTLWGLLAFVGQALIIALVYNLIEDVRSLENMLVAIVLGSVPVTVVAIADYLLGTSVLGTASHFLYASASSGIIRVTSTFNDPNALGTFMVFTIIVTFGVFRLERFKRWRGVLAVLLVAQVFSLIVTFSRGAFLALGIVSILHLLWQRGMGRRMIMAAFLAASVFILSSMSLLAILSERFRVGGVLDFDPSRLLIYRVSLDMVWRSPIFGYGPDNVSYVLGTVFGSPISPHSLYMEVLLGVGLLGAAAMAAFTVIQLVAAIRLRTTNLGVHARIVALALTGILVSGLTLHVFRANELWIALGLLAVLPRLESADEG